MTSRQSSIHAPSEHVSAELTHGENIGFESLTIAATSLALSLPVVSRLSTKKQPESPKSSESSDDFIFKFDKGKINEHKQKDSYINQATC